MHTCRDDFVLIEMRQRERSHGGILYPDICTDGKDHVILAVGPKVGHLKPGDFVLVIAQAGSAAKLPMRPSQYVTRASNVALVLEPTVEKQ